MSKHSKKAGLRICGLGVVILIVGITTSFLGAYNLLQINPRVIIPTTLAILMILGCIAASSMMAGTSFMAPMPHLKQPSDPEDGIFKRLIIDRETGKEYVIQGSKDSTYEEVLLDSWPFMYREETSQWYVVDDEGNNITNKSLSEYDSILEIVFE